MGKTVTENLIEFINASKSSFHAVAEMKTELKKNGFNELSEAEVWKLQKGGKYFVTRNDSSIIAFRIPVGDFKAFQIMASHSDSPTFRIKSNPEISVENKYIKLNTERYGGMIISPWFDRPLSVAGRVMVKTRNGVKTVLVDVDRDILLIPNLAVHMNREVNNGYKYNAQKDTLPLFSMSKENGGFDELIAKTAGVKKEDIVSTELYLYNRESGLVWGENNEFISAPRLDDLECAYASLQGIIAGKSASSVTVHAVFDNEEVGSGTKQGAAAGFLQTVLRRINMSMGRTEEDYHVALSNSFMISADNAHAVHPNYSDVTDPTNRPYINDGVVIKLSANQKYTTDAVSEAILKVICDRDDIPTQMFVNRSDMLGGSTLGNISNTQVALNTVDIGLPQLAMHSPFETAGVKDIEYLVKLAKSFFNSSISYDGKEYKIKG